MTAICSIENFISIMDVSENSPTFGMKVSNYIFSKNSIRSFLVQNYYKNVFIVSITNYDVRQLYEQLYEFSYDEGDKA